MSKFMRAVEAKWTGYEFAPLWPLAPLTVTRDVSSAVMLSVQRQYDVGVHWKTRVTCAPGALPDMLRNVKAQLREAVYGDFRDGLLRLERALYESDQKAALCELREVFRSIEE